MSHPDPNQIELFAIGALDPEEVAEISEHLDHCSRCSADLARELELERKLGELGRYADRDQAVAPIHELAPARRRRSVARYAAVVVGTIAAAAAVAFVVTQNLGQDAATAHTPTLISPICEVQPQRCVDAEQHGLVPALTATTIPRYEHLAPLPPATDQMLAFSRGTGGPQL